MTSRWDDRALALVRDIAGNPTSLDAAIEVLKTTPPQDRQLTTVDDLVKQCLRRQLDLLTHLKG
jgi:hypothetical protein